MRSDNGDYPTRSSRGGVFQQTTEKVSKEIGGGKKEDRNARMDKASRGNKEPF